MDNAEHMSLLNGWISPAYADNSMDTKTIFERINVALAGLGYSRLLRKICPMTNFVTYQLAESYFPMPMADRFLATVSIGTTRLP